MLLKDQNAVVISLRVEWSVSHGNFLKFKKGKCILNEAKDVLLTNNVSYF